MINGHIAFKYVYTRIFTGTDRIHKRDWVAISSWVGIALALWILAWIIASAIPVFSSLLSLITALFASWFSCKTFPLHQSPLASKNNLLC